LEIVTHCGCCEQKDISVWAANATLLFFSKEQMTEENTASKSLNKHACMTKQMTRQTEKMMIASHATTTKLIVSVLALTRNSCAAESVV